MCQQIKKSGKSVGFKASGGVRDFNDALIYSNIVKDILGNEWLKPELFRIGASSLYDNSC